MPDVPSVPVDYAALADFRHALRLFLVFSERRAAACGLTPQQHQALLAIRAAAADEVTVGFIADRLVLKPHSASGLVDRLEALGLVTRRASTADRRRTLTRLTPRADALLAELSETHGEELRRLKPLFADLLARLK